MNSKIKRYLRELLSRLSNPIKVKNAEETLNIIEREHSSIARFGDGEFDFIFGAERSFQNASIEMKKRLEEVLTSQNSKCLIGIPYAILSLSPYNTKSKRFWFCYFASKREQIIAYLNTDKQYYDSQITRIYINRKDKNESKKLFDKWKTIWNDKKVLIVEGELSRCGVGNDLFDGCKSVSRLICPAQNAFEKYDTILSKSIEIALDYDLLLLAIGPTATILAYDLCEKGIWAIDTGNMDNEYEWMRVGTKVPIANKNKYSFEAKNGDIVENINNAKYDSEIIGRID